MAAQSIKSYKQGTIGTRKPTPKQVKIIETKTDHPDLTTREIAAIAETDHSHVVKTLQTYGIDRVDVEGYTKHRPQIFSGLQQRILKSVTDDDIKSASVLQRVTAMGILYDKERIETGKAGMLIGVGVALSPGLQAAVDRIAARVQPVDKIE